MGLPLAIMTSKGMGTCTCHQSPQSQVGNVVQGSGNVFATGMPVSRINDMIIAGCGHTGIIIDGCGTVFVNGIPAAKLVSNFVGCFSGIIIKGASTVTGS